MEKYGVCGTCGGSGTIKVVEQDPILLRETVLFKECDVCNGSGFSGSAIYEPSYLKDHEEQMLDAIRAMNEGKY